tara:strand:- start:3033 stop:3509 length:477 start_codon:yes stop_codon:yes gene_type:complete
MKHLILNSILFLLAHFSWAQCGHNHYIFNSIPPTNSIDFLYSPYGNLFTPQGEIKVLLLFGGYEEDQLSLSSGFWPGSPGDADFETSLPNYEELFYTEATEFADDNNDQTLSNFFYQMTKHSPNPLKLIGAPFPHRINLEVRDIDIGSSAFNFTKGEN